MDNLNLYHELESILRKESKYCMEDGNLIKNKIVQDALSLHPDLLTHILKHEGLKNNFFSCISGTLVFDKVKFQQFVMNKSFLPDSYTAYKNKIGLTDQDGRYISESREVVLAWPYKDCILEGGQTKEEAKRNEIFWSETLAPDQISRLSEPKVLVNFKRYNKDGEHSVESFRTTDNLIIRGNNYLALNSCLKRYEGKIKAIYIDPPYNTGNDEFGYNDSFNHSTWLTFMKNRLEVAKKLLSIDGCILVHIDHHELFYIGALLDSIFGIENKVQVIAVKTATPAGFKTVNPGPIDVTEYILFYTKQKSSFKFKKSYVPVNYNVNYNLVVKKAVNIDDWSFTPISTAVLKSMGLKTEKQAREKYGNMWATLKPQLIAKYAYENADNVVSVRDPHKPTETVRALMKKSKETGKVIEYIKEDGSISYFYRGGALAFYSNKMQIIDGQRCITELLTDFWNHISWAGIAKEGGVKLKNGKKPEKLLKQIIEMVSEPNDIILDYHLGSGTTAAVAHKCNRQYIGIEQLDYGTNDSIERLKNVIAGDQTGVSESLNWRGGGSFVYCEIAKANELYTEKIMSATSTAELKVIWTDMKNTGYLNYKINISTIEANISDFESLTLTNQKRFLIECLDKNLLYVPFSEIDSKEFNISEEDKRLTREFYNCN